MAVKAYEGNQPYIFVSYAHKDAKTVLPILEALESLGFRLWYDAGIEAGSEWPEYIAEHLNNASRVLAFVSKNFVASQNCRREINFAIDLKKDPLVVYLEDFELSLGMRMQLGTLQGMMYYRHESFDSFIDALVKVKELVSCRDALSGESDEDIALAFERLLSGRMFEGVRSYAMTLLENGYDNALLYRALLLAEFGAKDDSELIKAQKPIDESEYYQKMMALADEYTKKRYTEYADAVRLCLSARAEGGRTKREELLEARIKTEGFLNRMREEIGGVKEELRVKELIRQNHGTPSHIVRWAIILLFAGLVNFIYFVRFTSQAGEATGWLVTGFLYYVCSLIQIKSTKKCFFWVFLNIPSLGCFGWIHAIISLAMLGRTKRLLRDIEALHLKQNKMNDAIARAEAELTRIKTEFEALI